MACYEYSLAFSSVITEHPVTAVSTLMSRTNNPRHRSSRVILDYIFGVCSH